jgi:hypothetical protein
VRFIREHGVRRAFINTPGTNAVWLADDDDGNGVYEFLQVLGPEDGLVLPADMLLSYDHRYMYLTNWFRNTVQQFDIKDPLNPVLKRTVSVPHPNMLRLSRDNRRLYVSNSLLTRGTTTPTSDRRGTTTTGSGVSTSEIPGGSLRPAPTAARGSASPACRRRRPPGQRART